MCGFVSIVKDEPFKDIDGLNSKIREMTSIIKHRGPDQEGFFIEDNVCLGFRRLSIIDLEKGSQPFSYSDGRYHIIFNGEIYNYIELRDQLLKEGAEFTTDSDTEVILAMYKYKGEEAVNFLRGMFAFLIWDSEKKELFGARDPFGIKPFFYYESEDTLYCASEKKSLHCIDNFNSEIDVKSLHNYLTFQFVPEPQNILKQVHILEPGHTIKKQLNKKAEIKKYWNIEFKPNNESIEKKVEEIREVMKDSVKVHMRSDVPVGAFLSGGIDSTIIVALCREIKPDIKTFTVGFERSGFSEIDLAKETAKELGVVNYSKVITPEEFVNELPKIIWHMDDPMADPAAVPLYFVAKEARKHVKVVLSGEGSDELFGGYNIYREPNSLKAFSYLPKSLKGLLKTTSSILPEGMKGKSFLLRGCTSIQDRYVGNANIFKQAEKSLYLKDFNANYTPSSVTGPLYSNIANYDDVIKMQYIDINTWLRGDILVKADRMTMAHSLELRVPFLDKEVFRVASKLNMLDKIGNGTTKYALRKAFKGIIPDSVTTRKKLGFPVPIRHWLKNELYDWALNLIEESNTEAYFNKDNVINMLKQHKDGPLDYSRRIWTILIFMLWHKIYIEKKFSPVFNDNYNDIENQVAVE